MMIESAGSERPLFCLANGVNRIVAADLYKGEAESWGWGAEFMRNPAKYAPFPYRERALEVQGISGLDLKCSNNSSDSVYTLSSIEHFGDEDASRGAVRGMARVTKPGGVVCIATELQLNRGRPVTEIFTLEELKEFVIEANGIDLVDPEIDLRISESLLVHPFQHMHETDTISPHIVLSGKDNVPVVWTSVILFFRKTTAESSESSDAPRSQST